MKSILTIVDYLKAQKNFCALSDEHHLQGLFYQHFNDSHLPEVFSRQYKRQWIYNTIVLEELELLSRLATQFESKATLLKGAHLLLDLYEDMGSRFLSDIDLMIDPNDVKSWEKILIEGGYTPREEEKFYGNNFKQLWSKMSGELEITIELHTKLFFHTDIENWEITDTRFAHLTKLKNEDLIVHLCGHLAFQHTFSKLYWLFDIFLFIQQKNNEIDWEKVLAIAKANKLIRSVQMCLWLLKRYFDFDPGKKALAIFEVEKEAWWKKYFTYDFLLYPHEKKWNYFILKHATKDRLTSALYYDLTWFYYYKIRKSSSPEKA